MLVRTIHWIVVTAGIFACLSTALAQDVIDIGSRLEPLIDEHLFARKTGSLRLRLHRPVRQADGITLDKPWEGNNSAYATVLKHQDQFFFYYRGTALVLDGKVQHEHLATTCVMTSRDGVQWKRPDLGFVQRDGWEKNNIILTFDPACKIDFSQGQTLKDGHDLLSGKRVSFTGASHNFTPLIDTNPQCNPQEKFKALGGHDYRTLYAFASPDGLHWTLMQPEPVIVDGMMDSQNLAFWDPVQKKYFAYYRDFKNKKGDTRQYAKHEFSLRDRDVRVATSTDFVNWTKGDWVDWRPDRVTQLYTTQTQLYPGAEHLRIGFPLRYVPGRGRYSQLNERIAASSTYYASVYTDTGFTSSRDGRTFHIWPEALLRPGTTAEQWFYGFGSTALNLFESLSRLPGGQTEWSFYVQDHGSWFGQGVTYQRYSIRQDGFVSASASLSGGSFTTRPLRFSGDQLLLNYSTSALGAIRVEVQEATGKPIPGFSLDDCVEQFGNALKRAVIWKQGADVSGIAGKPIRLRFELKDADLFSLRFAARR